MPIRSVGKRIALKKTSPSLLCFDTEDENENEAIHDTRLRLTLMSGTCIMLFKLYPATQQ